MRTVSAQEEIIYGSLSQGKTAVRVEIKDAGGTWRDMSSYPGFDSVKTVSITDSVDDPHMLADIVLYKRSDDLNLSPFMQASAPNLAFVAGAAFVSPLIWVNRECRVSYAMVPEDEVPSSWSVIWHGRIDEIDPSGEEIKLKGRDLGGALAMAWVKKEYIYGMAKVAGVGVRCRYFEPDDLCTLNEYTLPKGKANGYFYKVTSIGSTTHHTAVTEPTWPTVIGNTVVSGDITFQCTAATTATAVALEDVIQQVLTDFGSGVSLYTPVATGTNVNAFILPRGALFEALRNLALLTIGWDLRYKWDGGSSTFRLTLSQPTRTGATSLRTFSAADYDAVSEFHVTIEDIRNAWHGVYSDSADLWPDGNPKRKDVDVSDSASITKYGEQWAEIIEDSVSPLDTAAEMTTLLNAALADCKEPTVTAKFSFKRGFVHVERGDYYTFSGNGSEHDQPYSMAVTTLSHNFTGGHLETEIGVRGQPSLGTRRWIDMSTWVRPGGQHRTQPIDSTKQITLGVASVVGGTKVSATCIPEVTSEGVEYEWHVSPTTPVVPSSATLKAVSRDTAIVVADAIPGKTYYATAVPRFRNASKIVRGLPCPEISFVAGQANAAHLSNTYDPSQFPLNGDFESQMDPAAPPDHWTDTSDPGVWGSGMYLVAGSGAVSGKTYLKLDLNYSAVATWTMFTELFPLQSGPFYNIKLWVQRFSGTTGDIQIWFYQYDYAGSSVTTQKIYDITSATPTAWTEVGFRKQISATARYGRIIITSAAGANNIVAGIDKITAVRDLSAGNFLDYIGAPDTTVSATFVAITGASTTINQSSLGGWYLINISVSCYSTIANTEVEFSIKVDGTSVYLFRFFFNAASQHTCISANYVLLATTTTGAHTFAVEWRRMSGTGTLHIDTNDWIKMSVLHAGGN